MSCNFDIKKCLSCPKYNGCLLQLTYSNTINLANMFHDLLVKNNELLEAIKSVSISSEKTSQDNLDIYVNVDDLSTKLDKITSLLEDSDSNQSELLIDVSTIKEQILNVDTKIDTLNKIWGEYDYTSVE